MLVTGALLVSRAMEAARPSGLVRAQRQVMAALATAVGLSVAWFFGGGGWNQNAHFATTVALVDDGTLLLERYRASTGDLAQTPERRVVSAKPLGTALAAVPGYLLSGPLSSGIAMPGDRLIVRAYLTSLLTSGLALVGLALLLYRLLRQRLDPGAAAWVSLALCLATPLWPNATMLNSHALVALTAVSAMALLLPRPTLSSARLFAVGLLAALPATLEYMTAVLLLPLGLFALRRARSWRVLWWCAGVALVAALPLGHHLLLYGHPLHTGYASLTHAGFARDAGLGVMGFVGPSAWRLWQLTFGPARGFFYLSPFLLLAVPGLALLLRDPRSRPVGLTAGAIAWGVLLLVASLVYWHSGSATGSRYALLFVPFSACALAAALAAPGRWGHLAWAVFALGALWGFGAMLLAASVCPIPPTPSGPAPQSVIGWWWHYFARGELAHYQFPVLAVAGLPATHQLPYAFNLGLLAGLPGRWSLAPYLAALAGTLVWLAWAIRRAAATGADLQPTTTAAPPAGG